MFGVITLATSKGGAGKSTLARSLAAHWLQLGRKPALVDADPQRTLASRHNPERAAGRGAADRRAGGARGAGHRRSARQACRR